MKLIFLDIDGVLNHESFYKKKHNLIFPTSKFDEFSVSLLNKLTDLTGAKIIISSTWRIGRTVEEIKKLFVKVGITGEVIGKTPRLSFLENIVGLGSVPRGSEIKAYLESEGFRHINWSKEKQEEYMNKSDIDNYIILDDDSDMLYQQRNHFIHVLPSPRNKTGFNQTYFDKAYMTLSKTVIDLNY